jgi:hypothetical protein
LYQENFLLFPPLSLARFIAITALWNQPVSLLTLPFGVGVVVVASLEKKNQQHVRHLLRYLE